MTHNVMPRRWQLAVVGVLASVLLVAPPLTSGAAASAKTASSGRAPAVGNTYGGITAQDWPVIVTMKANRRLIVRAVAAVDMSCTAGGTTVQPVHLVGIPVNKKGKFARSFGPQTVRNADGTTTDFSGRIAGALNRAKTRILSGQVRFKFVEHDAAGAVTDTCDSGIVRWTAAQ
jgi:hypothetical protein